MKRINYLNVLGAAVLAVSLYSCSGSSDLPVVSTADKQIGQVVDDSKPLAGSIKGTLLKGKTYELSGKVTIQEGDTLLVQEGVRVNAQSGSYFVVKGVMLSLGTKENPVWMTVAGKSKLDNPTTDIASDPAYTGEWSGICCDHTCKLFVSKWTHYEYVGAIYDPEPVLGCGTKPRVVYFANPDGQFIFEDNWVYGTVFDVVRLEGGHINIMRNTIEKSGFEGGEAFNIKGSTKGNIAYNLFIGMGTTSSKASNINSTAYQCDIATYNNTILNGGYRRVDSGRGGSINYEEGAKGLIYNNIIVNCRYGTRLVKNPAADVANIKLGYNLNYGEDQSITEQFYPVGHLTSPQATDIPSIISMLPAGYNPGDAYDGSLLVGQNDVMFVNYPLGNTFANIRSMAYVGSFDFRLQAGSPAIGKGFTGFTPYQEVSVDPMFGSSEITPPSVDLGCYPTDGKGNQHF